MSVAERLILTAENLKHVKLVHVTQDEVDDGTYYFALSSLRFIKLPPVIQFRAMMESWEFDRIKTVIGSM